MQPDTAAALEFLQKWEPGGPWVLTAISTDRTQIDTATFECITPDEEEGVSTWINRFNGERNLYFHVNPCMTAMSRKASRADIASLNWLHVDVDPRAGEDLRTEQDRARSILTDKLPEGVPEPTVVIFSGGGYQAFWKLQDPLPIKGQEEAYEEAKRYNLQLEVLFGADDCHNVDRIMRLPGTINIPDAKKRKKGRTETLAELVSFRNVSYPITDFAMAVLRQTESSSHDGIKVEAPSDVPRISSMEDLNEWHVPARVQVIIVQGHHPDEIKEGDSSRSEWLFDVVCNLVRCDVPDDVIYGIITDPDWAIAESVLDKGSGTERYALRQIGRAKEYAINPVLVDMNQRFAVVGNIGGKCRVIEEQEDPILKRTHLTLQTFADFKNRFMNQSVEIAGKSGPPRSVPLGDWWLKSPQRRQYERIIFSPGGDRPGAHNMWRGFAYDARPGNCELYLEHIRKNLCCDVEEHYRYLLDWMALLVQHPDRAGQVAVVLRGGKGTGKGSFAKHFGAILGRHYMQVNNAKYLVGNFNFHLRDVVLVFGDEAFYAGNKQHEATLQGMITEDTISIEKKGYDVETYPNYVHVILASNSDWIIPAGAQERRYFVLEVSDARLQDTTYFAEIAKEMTNGGYEALLHALATRDLAQYDVRNVPKTAALGDQKVRSLDPHDSWWYEKLLTGSMLHDGMWPEDVHKIDLQANYYDMMSRERVVRPMANVALGRFLSGVCPELGSRQSGKPYKGSARPYIYMLPTLAKCRQAWDDLHGEQTWPEVETVATEEDDPF